MNDRNAAEILALLTHFSTPCPNGRRTIDHSVDAVEAWLAARGIPVESHHFTLHPYAMELLGLRLLLGGLLLAVFVTVDAPWLVLLVTFALLAVPLLETRCLQPTIMALVRRRARNLVVSFPAPAPSREVILGAHLDSKTELLVSGCSWLGMWQMVFVHCAVEEHRHAPGERHEHSHPGHEYVICNCCACGCVPYILNRELGRRVRPPLRGEFVAWTHVNRCVGDGACVDVCPFGARAMIDGRAALVDTCLGCGLCAAACPHGAIQMCARS